MTATDLDLPSLEQPSPTDVMRKTRVDPPHGPGSAVEVSVSCAPLLEGVDGRPIAEDDLAEPVFPEESRDGLAAAGGSPKGAPLALEVEEPTEAMLAAVAGANLDAQRQQLQFQVAQLAEHLQARLRDVDRRESLLGAREAQLEAELRAARLWHQERQRELAQREQAWSAERDELRAQIEDLTHQLSLLRGAANGGHNGSVEAKQAELKAWEAELDRRQQELEARAAGWRPTQQAAPSLDEAQRALAERQAALEAAQSLVEKQMQQLFEQHAALVRDQQAWRAWEAAQRARLAQQQQEADVQIAQQQRHLEQWQVALERQAAGLHRLRDELLQLHRQALESRLAAEQMALGDVVPTSPAARAKALAEVRQQLAAQYRWEEESLAARRQELMALGKRLTARHEELRQLRAGLRDWLAERQRELQEQAAACMAQEEELAARRQQLLAQHEALLAQHQALKQKLRVLVRQLGPGAPSSLAADEPAEGSAASARTGGVEGAASVQ